MFIKSKHIYFRALESTDLELLYTFENNALIWKVSNTITPFSKDILQLYLQTAHQDIYTNKQLRLMICKCDNDEAIGTVDLFEFEPQHLRVGVGILIFDQFRKKGYAFEALELIKLYVFNTLTLNQLFCNIGTSNTNSIALFEKIGFTKIGVKKQWNRVGFNKFEDELMYQFVQNFNIIKKSSN